jgi:hypothetical protein
VQIGKKEVGNCYVLWCLVRVHTLS